MAGLLCAAASAAVAAAAACWAIAVSSLSTADRGGDALPLLAMCRVGVIRGALHGFLL